MKAEAYPYIFTAICYTSSAGYDPTSVAKPHKDGAALASLSSNAVSKVPRRTKHTEDASCVCYEEHTVGIKASHLPHRPCLHCLFSFS
jgi:hypothetical protein